MISSLFFLFFFQAHCQVTGVSGLYTCWQMVAAKNYTCTLSGCKICVKRKRLALRNEWSGTFCLYLAVSFFFFFFLKQGTFGVFGFFILDLKHLSGVIRKGRVHHYSVLLRGWMHTLELHPSTSFSQKPFLKALSLSWRQRRRTSASVASITRSAELKATKPMCWRDPPPSDGCLFSLRPIRKSLAVFSPSLNA